MSKKILFLGAGKMGSAILRGLLGSGYDRNSIAFVEPHKETRESLLAETKLQCFEDRIEGILWADVILLAIKPQIWKTLSAEIEEELGKLAPKTFISIMAGINLAQLGAHLPQAQIVRTMPNLPLTIGKGAVGYCLRTESADLHGLIQTIFAPIGLTTCISESQMDALTGLSGSGPAFVFQVIEGMVQGGVLCGLARGQAEDLAYQTLIGSIELWRQSGKNPGALSAEVCSPGGTTIAGVQVLEDRALRGTLMQAIQAAARRSAELG